MDYGLCKKWLLISCGGLVEKFSLENLPQSIFQIFMNNDRLISPIYK